MNLDLLKQNNVSTNVNMHNVKFFRNGSSYYNASFYSEDLTYEFQKYSELEKGMKILIPDCVKKKILIRKVVKYFKENNLDIKIVNNPEEANTLCLPKEMIPTVAENYLEIDPNTNKPLSISYYTKNNNSIPVRKISLYYNSTSKFMRLFGINKIEDLQILFSDRYKIISDTILSDITTNQYILDCDDIEINSHKLKTMLVEENSCKILCAALRNRDLTEYMTDIINAYYLTNSGICRSLIRSKLLMRYKEADCLIQFGDSYSNQIHKIGYYLSTMKRLKLEPDKEIALEIIGFYKD